ncbi:hypothetical protein SRRS_14550 [Sporomusa rhizae]|uniref:hypothetical protein n=1 Tax=Sporomusa rhizae TaxID=357999 RepID=UPI00352B988D
MTTPEDVPSKRCTVQRGTVHVNESDRLLAIDLTKICCGKTNGVLSGRKNDYYVDKILQRGAYPLRVEV